MEQLIALLNFLNNPAHRQYNKLLQTNSYRSMMMPWRTPAERIKALLYHIASTQAQPAINQLAITFQNLDAHRNELSGVTNIEQLANFAALLHGGNPANGAAYERLFRNLSAAPGFGPKTAALFIKSLIDIHAWDETVDLRFLQCFQRPTPHDRTYIPIDRVIWFVFNYINYPLPLPANAFMPLNDLIWDHHGTEPGLQNESIRIWDDLWFWGTFAQMMQDGEVIIQINHPKFLVNPAAPHQCWPQIEDLLNDFIALLNLLRAVGIQDDNQ